MSTTLARHLARESRASRPKSSVKRRFSFSCANWLAFCAGIFLATAIAFAHAQTLTPGSVAAWGYNSTGQLVVPSGLANVSAITAGQNNSAALRNDGSQLNIHPGLSGVASIGTRENHTLA
jgi:hypothetical protein